MAALQTAAAEHGVGLVQCGARFRELLAQVLSWLDALLDKVESYTQQQGVSPQLKFPSDVLTPLDELWPQALNRLDGPRWLSINRGEWRSLIGSVRAELWPWSEPVLLSIMVFAWLNISVLFWLKQLARGQRYRSWH